MIPENVIGTLDVLSVSEGDIRLQFDPDNPEDVEKAKRQVSDMLRRGYLLFVEDFDSSGAKKLRRVKRFSAKSCCYIVEIPDEDKTKEVPATKAKAHAVPRTAGG